MTLLRALRAHHWVKNLLLFLPALMAHRVAEPDVWRVLAVAFASFSLVASGMYLVNDLADAGADRRHPTKRDRPVAAGAVAPGAALLLAVTLVGVGAVVAWLAVSPAFLGMLGIYVVLTGLYSSHLKRVAVLDVLVLAGLYTHRVLAGGVASATPLSTWLLSFATYFFLSLAMLKRYTELRRFAELGRQVASQGRGYLGADLDIVRAIGPASGYLSVLVLGLYLNSDNVLRLYARPAALWVLTPLFLYWLTRIWLLAHRGRVDDDPIVFAVRDWQSYAVGVLVAAVLLYAA